MSRGALWGAVEASLWNFGESWPARALRGLVVPNVFFFDWNRHMQEFRGALGPKSPKSLKKVFPGLAAQSVKKVSREAPKYPKKSQKGVKISVRGPFRHFLTLWAGRPF